MTTTTHIMEHEMTRVITFLMMMVVSSFAFADGATKTLEKEVGGWTVQQYHSDDGSFSHCMINTDYVPANKQNQKKMKSSMMNVGLKLFSSEAAAFLLSAPDWKFKEEDKFYKVTFRFDNGKSFDLSMKSNPPFGLYQEFSLENSDWLQAMMASKSVELTIDDHSLGGFSLDGSRKAIEELLVCWGANMNLGEKNEENTFGNGQ